MEPRVGAKVGEPTPWHSYSCIMQKFRFQRIKEMNLKALYLLCVISVSNAFINGRINVCPSTLRMVRMTHDVHSSLVDTNYIPKTSLMVADGLDADTLGALGDMQGADIDIDGIVQSASNNPATSILLKLSGTPLVVVIPILAGVLVALSLAFGISSYSNGKGD